MYKGKTAKIIQTIVIAIAYIVLSYIADMFGMAKGIVQVRISDALCVLPYFTPAAIPGLFIGSIISNIIISLTEDPMTGKMVLSAAAQQYILFSGLSILAASIVSYCVRKFKFVVAIPPIVFNSITMPMIFHYVFRYEDSVAKCFMTVLIGEIISCGLLGTALLLALEDSKDKLFPGNNIAKVSKVIKGTMEDNKSEGDEENV